MKLNQTYLHDQFTLHKHIYNTRGLMKLKLNTFNTIRYGKETISYNGTMLWNDMPDDFRDTMSIKDFKRKILVWNGPKCA